MAKWQRILYQPNLPLGSDGSRVTACKEHRELSKNAAKEGMVLLKNETKLLPLSADTKLALFGKGTFDYVKGGGGSGDVTVSYIKNLYDGITELHGCAVVCPELTQFYMKYVLSQYEAKKEPGMIAEPAITDELCKIARRFTDTAIITISRFSGEGWDRKTSGDFYLSHAESEMIEKVKIYFDKIIIVMNVGGIVDTNWFISDPQIKSVLMAWQAGMEGGLATAELLYGIGNPSGKLSDTFAKSLEDYPSSYNFNESEDYVDYTDDIYVGYRYFETIPDAYQKVNYPFGYGLSYTTFSWNVTSTTLTNGEYTDTLTVTVDVTNTGDVAGREVIQLYANAPQGILGKAARSLIAFTKTNLLSPGETEALTLSFPINDLASYDDLGKIQKSAYILEAGEYKFYLGNSVRNVQCLKYGYTLSENKIVAQLSPKLVPTSLSKRMLADGSYEDLPTGSPNDPDYCPLGKMATIERDGLSPEVRHTPGYYLWTTPYDKSEKVHTLKDVDEGHITMEQFLGQLSDEDVAYLLCGQPNTGVSNTFGIGNNRRYGIPNAMTADGPAGLRIEPQCGVHTTAFPCATLLACSFDPEIVYKVGEAGAKEVKENNIAMWLTPAINIHRSPLCGRNFEYYSEDPFLTGMLASAMVMGIQSQHISASVKHFAVNNKETNRKYSDSRVSERAAREIYLRAFEIIVKNAKPWCIMSSYNIINGHRACENKELLTDILRDEWGYTGLVTSDWWTAGEHYKEVLAGNDVKMPLGFPSQLLEALDKGLITRDDMDRCAKRVLELLMKLD